MESLFRAQNDHQSVHHTLGSQFPLPYSGYSYWKASIRLKMWFQGFQLIDLTEEDYNTFPNLSYLSLGVADRPQLYLSVKVHLHVPTE